MQYCIIICNKFLSGLWYIFVYEYAYGSNNPYCFLPSLSINKALVILEHFTKILLAAKKLKHFFTSCHVVFIFD